MALDLKLDERWDMDRTGGDWNTVQNGAEVIQSGGIRMLTIQGEDVFFPELGIPWWRTEGGTMFDPQVSLEEKSLYIKRTLLETQGVTRLTRFEFKTDPVNKGAEVEWGADTIYGSTDVIGGTTVR